MLSRYLLFTYDADCPIGGLGDFRGDYSSLDLAVADANNDVLNWGCNTWQILDTQDGTITNTTCEVFDAKLGKVANTSQDVINSKTNQILGFDGSHKSNPNN